MSFWTPPKNNAVYPAADWESSAFPFTGTAVVHPALLIAPQRSQGFPESMPGIAGDWFEPPPAVLAAAFARRWRFSCDLQSPGVSYVVTDEEVEAPVSDWQAGIPNRSRGSWNELRDGATCGENDLPNWLHLSWGVGGSDSVPFLYDWEGGAWWPALSVRVQARDFCSSPEFSTAGVGGSVYTGQVSAVGLEFCGAAIPLRLTSAFSSGAALAGWIKIDAVEWLSVR